MNLKVDNVVDIRAANPVCRRMEIAGTRIRFHPSLPTAALGRWRCLTTPDIALPQTRPVLRPSGSARSSAEISGNGASQAASFHLSQQLFNKLIVGASAGASDDAFGVNEHNGWKPLNVV